MTVTPKTPTVVRYRVVDKAGVTVQVQGDAPESHPERLMRAGDVLPTWTDPKQVRLLLEFGFVEAVA